MTRVFRAKHSDKLKRIAIAQFAVDVRALAAVRIVLSLAILVRISSVALDATAFLTDDGVLPRRLLLHFIEPSSSLYLLNGSAAFATVLLVINTIAALALLIGYRARVAAAVCWVLCLSLAQRNPLITTGGDALASALLFWSIFLPIGRAFSVDAALPQHSHQAPQPADQHLSIASAGFMLQAFYVYFFGALLKTGAEWHSAGSAVYLALSFDSIATPMAHWLRKFDWATIALTHGVWWIEVLSPLFLFSPVRTWCVRAIALPFFMFMHVCFTVFLDIGNFWIVSLASLVVFTPSFVWDFIERRLWRPAQHAIAIYYDEDCAFCRKTAFLLRMFFLPRGARVAPAQTDAEIGAVLARERSWVVVSADGERRLAWEALVFVLGQSVWGQPLAAIARALGGAGAGRRLYEFVGARRLALGRLISDVGPRAPFHLSARVQATLLLPLAVSLLWNIRDYVGARSLLSPADKMVAALGLSQHWSMFAPYPQYEYVVPVVEGRLADGHRVDLLNGRNVAPSYEWPRYPIFATPSTGWRKYFNGLGVHQPRFAPTFYNRYATYQCDRWLRRTGARLAEVKITILRARTLSRNHRQQLQPEVHRFTCPS